MDKEEEMSNKLAPTGRTTIVTTGKGKKQSIVAGKPLVSSSTGKVEGSGQVDVVFVFDTTGSMNNKINALIQTCAQFVEEPSKMKLDPQFALISFGDILVEGGGDRIELVVPLTPEIAKITYGLNHIPRNNGFGNVGESSMEAMQEVFKLPYRPKAVKVAILITDEPAHQHQFKATQVTAKLKEREFLVFVIATDEPYYQEMARKNGGIWKEISANTDLSEILAIFKEIAKKVSLVVQNVYLIGKGSVKEYLKLKPPG
jgi:Mg-chelatase subunit ChlD